ncbi:hypothetical protein NAV33_07360 [Pseudomonas stutzeri]|uniref:hypothetical protein n=1 Tax=Stutzerimonas stutzeri TaxID=316 RepID=UPI002108764E|nr:hypothetical protein [Stutzerimonas stutzeri]MCQ4311712.1 hypothetical protein [Stutzerimonas stutzeri]
MNMQVTLDISEKFAAAINGLSEAIRAISGAQADLPAAASAPVEKAADKTPKGSKADTKSTSKSESKAATGPIFWADNSTGFFGKVDSEAEYAAKKAEADGVYKTTESIYEEKLAALKAKDAADAKAEKEAKAAEKKPTESKKTATEHPSLEELVAVFASYLPKDLPKEERAERHAFVKPLLQRFGAAKATELLPEHRALAMNLVERKIAGEDIDPESGEFAEIAAESEDDLV